MTQKTVPLNLGVGIPGEFAALSPRVVTTYRLVANTAQTPSPAITFGVAYTFAPVGEVTNPGYLAHTQTAQPGAATVADHFAGILVHPKEHALYGTAAGGPLAPSFVLPDGSWGALCTTGILYAYVTSAAGAGNPGDALAFNLADGTLVAFAPGATVPATAKLIPGAFLRSSLGAPQTNALAKIELNTVASAA